MAFVKHQKIRLRSPREGKKISVRFIYVRKRLHLSISVPLNVWKEIGVKDLQNRRVIIHVDNEQPSHILLQAVSTQDPDAYKISQRPLRIAWNYYIPLDSSEAWKLTKVDYQPFPDLEGAIAVKMPT